MLYRFVIACISTLNSYSHSSLFLSSSLCNMLDIGFLSNLVIGSSRDSLSLLLDSSESPGGLKMALGPLASGKMPFGTLRLKSLY